MARLRHRHREDIPDTEDISLWEVIKLSTEAISFNAVVAVATFVVGLAVIVRFIRWLGE